MKQKHLFGGILCIGLVFMMVLAGCGYDGPSVDEISNGVVAKSPTADDIANTALERSELSQYSRQVKQYLANSGKLTITKDILAWGQTDVAYTLAVNTAERQYFSLPNDTSLTWDGDGNADIKRSDSYIVLAEKSDGKSATFNFTITDSVDTTKTIKGTLTITTSYDNSTVGVANLNEFFEKFYSYNLDDETTTFTTVKPIASWGQTDAAYTIDANIYEYDSVIVYSPNSAPVLYNQNNYNWTNTSVEWKPPVIATEITADISNGSPSGSTYIGGNNLYFSSYSGTRYYLYTDSTTVKTATFTFRITRDDQTISGTVTVNIKMLTKTPAQLQQEAEEEQLEDLRYSFSNSLRPNYSYYNGGVVSRFIDKGITAFGQEDVLYTISVRGGNNYDYDYDTDEDIYYGTVSLPSVYDGTITWTTKTANAAVVLSGSYLKVYTGKTGTAEFSFTYTNPDNKTVKGTVKVTAIK